MTQTMLKPAAPTEVFARRSRLRRALDFPDGIAVGDTLAIPNTAGYFMHILESASHQIPLARNVVRTEDEAWELDAIDREWIRV